MNKMSVLIEVIYDLKCSVCLENYSDRAAPRNFGCGHSVCTVCLQEIIKTDKSCPECRTKFKAQCVGDFIINYPILRLARMHAFVCLEKEEIPPPKLLIGQPGPGPVVSVGTCSVHGCSLFFMCVRCNVFLCRDCLLSDHLDQPNGRCLIISVQHKINAIRESHLKNIPKCLKDASEINKKLLGFAKGSRFALNYWEKRPLSKRNEDYDKNLEEARRFNEAAEKELDMSIKWMTMIKEIVEQFNEVKSLDEVNSLGKVLSNLMSDIEKYQPEDKESEIQLLLSPFWTGRKYKC